jgi:hypothetical protein
MRGTQRATADSRVGTVSLSVCSPSSCIATMTATLTMRPASRVLTWVASIHWYGQSPSIWRFRKAPTRSSSSPHRRETWLLETLKLPCCCEFSDVNQRATWSVARLELAGDMPSPAPP